MADRWTVRGRFPGTGSYLKSIRRRPEPIRPHLTPIARRLEPGARRPGVAQPTRQSAQVTSTVWPRTRSSSVPRRGMLAFTPEEAGLRSGPRVVALPGDGARWSARRRTSVALVGLAMLAALVVIAGLSLAPDPNPSMARTAQPDPAIALEAARRAEAKREALAAAARRTRARARAQAVAQRRATTRARKRAAARRAAVRRRRAAARRLASRQAAARTRVAAAPVVTPQATPARVITPAPTARPVIPAPTAAPPPPAPAPAPAPVNEDAGVEFGD